MSFPFTRTADNLASPVLFHLLVTGQHMKTVTFELRKAGSAGPGTPKPVVLAAITLSMVFVTHLEQSVSAGDDSPTEVVHFAYGAMSMAFNQQSPQGTTTPGPSVSWNQVTNNSDITALAQ